MDFITFLCGIWSLSIKGSVWFTPISSWRLTHSMLGMGMMLFVIVIVGLVVWGEARLTTDSRDHPDTIDTAAEILEKRLERGEISYE